MSERGYALFDTALGCCGIAWTPGGIAGTSLPSAGSDAARSRLAQRSAGEERAPPAVIATVVEAISRLLDGEPRILAFNLGDGTLQARPTTRVRKPRGAGFKSQAWIEGELKNLRFRCEFSPTGDHERASVRTRSRPSSFRRSTTMQRLSRARLRHHRLVPPSIPRQPRSGSPPGGSILITSAPK